MSTASSGTCTYLITEPRIKQFFTDSYRQPNQLVTRACRLPRYHVWVAFHVLNGYLGQLHVEELVHGLQRSGNDHVILELDAQRPPHKGLEE